MDRHSITPSMIEAWKGDAAGMQEKQLRQFAARRAIELGYGGIAFVSEALGINRKTIKLGIEEIKSFLIVTEEKLFDENFAGLVINHCSTVLEFTDIDSDVNHDVYTPFNQWM